MTLVGGRIKPRVVVLTDIENEPDDAMSLVRFLTYSNHWDVEALVATTSIHLPDEVAPWRIREIVEAYGQVRDNLELHETGFPTAEALFPLIKAGLPLFGLRGVGRDGDSPGSEALIAAVDREDTRPLWVLVWGGTNVLAQALWKVARNRPESDLARFVSRLRVYAISDQDDTGPWLRSTFPDLFYIVSPGFVAGGAYHHSTWSGIGGDRFSGRFGGADFSLVDNPWLDEHVRCKGPLGAQYPRTVYMMEGDTPTFLYLVDNGLGNPDHPDWGSWGGRYELYIPRTQKWFSGPETRPVWSDAADEVMGLDGHWHTTNKATIWRWRSAYQHDFAARMDWTVRSYAEANHPPVVRLDHPAELTARPGDRVELSALATSDPDGRALSFRWFHYGEPGTFAVSNSRTGCPVPLDQADRAAASFVVPTGAFKTGSMHFIVEVTNQDPLPLTRYRRVIVHVGG